jgi:hypothetical protein
MKEENTVSEFLLPPKKTLAMYYLVTFCQISTSNCWCQPKKTKAENVLPLLLKFEIASELARL